MWATLALDALIRHSALIAELSRESSQFYRAVGRICKAFTTVSPEADDTEAARFPWLTHGLSSRHMIVGSLLIACDRLFPYSASVDVESGSPRYFCHVFFQFHDNTQFLQDEPVPNNLDNWGITPLSQLMRELNEGSINHMLDVAKFLLLWQHSEEKFTRTAIEQAITNCVDEVCLNIQEYIHDKLRLPDYPDYAASDTAT